MRASFLFLAACLSLLFACTAPGADRETELTALAARAKELSLRHELLDARIDSLWDSTALQLEKALPPDFPPVDREIFLTSRNVYHITMFMSFDRLDQATQDLVYAAGKADEQLSGEMQKLAEEQRSFEADKMKFLDEISQSAGQQATVAYTEKLKELTR